VFLYDENYEFENVERGRIMKKTFIFVLLLLSLFANKVNAAPNTGELPENGVKVNFNENGSVKSFEGEGWVLDEQSLSLTLTKGDVVVTLNEYVFNDGEELVGFSWMIEGATAVLWVKHGTTSDVYGEGTDGEFTTSDNKGVSNAVFLIEILVDEEDDEDDESDDEEEQDDEDEELDDEEEQDDEGEELDDEEEQDDEDEESDDEEEQDDEDEELDEEEEQDDEDEVLGDDEEDDEEENVDEEEDEVLGEDEEESLPDTSDASKGFGLMVGLMGLLLLVVTKKKAVA
jgi:hypothetical protein